MSYKKSGVNIETGDKFVSEIKPFAKKTYRKGVMSSIGGYGSVFDINKLKLKEPLIVSTTDGVGTKLKLSINFNQLEKIGIDLVAMCVNDLICIGAEPLFFLDYYATSKLNINDGKQIIKGISKGCLEANISLIGGETAEMPGLYQKKDFDLAGFAVGVVEKEKQFPKKIQDGDIILGLKSSGFHSNGYSLIRYLIKKNQILLTEELKKLLLNPTKIYVKSIMKIKNEKCVKGFAHITGGGLENNIPRILSNNLTAEINLNSWSLPICYKWFFNEFGYQKKEHLKAFNCGIGMVIIVDKNYSENIKKMLINDGEEVYEIGVIKKGKKISFQGELTF